MYISRTELWAVPQLVRKGPDTLFVSVCVTLCPIPQQLQYCVEHEAEEDSEIELESTNILPGCT